MKVWAYPGGKARLAKRLVDKMAPWLAKAQGYYEPFVGGGSVAILVAERYPAMPVTVNDLEQGVVEAWRAIATGKLDEIEWQIRRAKPELGAFGLNPSVEGFGFDYARAANLSTKAPYFDLRDGEWQRLNPSMWQAACHIYLNRTSYAGKGKNPEGGRKQARSKLSSKWKPEALITELRRLVDLFAGRLTVTSEPATSLVARLSGADVAYLDPPYFKAGAGFYQHSFAPHDHSALADVLRRTRARWLLSYDRDPAIAELYGDWARVGIIRCSYPMRSRYSTASHKKREYLISRAALGTLQVRALDHEVPFQDGSRERLKRS